jgi:hypothetical protein
MLMAIVLGAGLAHLELSKKIGLSRAQVTRTISAFS